MHVSKRIRIIKYIRAVLCLYKDQPKILLHVLSRSVVSDSCNQLDCNPPGSSIHGTSGKNTGVRCHFRLQGIFPTQELNPCFLCLLHCRQILDALNHQGSPSVCQLYFSERTKPNKHTDLILCCINEIKTQRLDIKGSK